MLMLLESPYLTIVQLLQRVCARSGLSDASSWYTALESARYRLPPVSLREMVKRDTMSPLSVWKGCAITQCCSSSWVCDTHNPSVLVGRSVVLGRPAVFFSWHCSDMLLNSG